VEGISPGVWHGATITKDKRGRRARQLSYMKLMDLQKLDKTLITTYQRISEVGDAAILGSPIACFPQRYLGLPLLSHKVSAFDCLPLIASCDYMAGVLLS
jgi:hypothetical protein